MPVEHTPTHQMPTRSTLSPSLATDQRSLLDPRTRYPLWPPLLGGDPTHSDERVQYPVEVGYDLASLRDPTNRAGLLGDPVVSAASVGRAPPAARGGGGPGRWRHPTARGAAAGGFHRARRTHLCQGRDTEPDLEPQGPVELRHPQHRVGVRRPGVVAAFSGNHGASAAAHAARVGLGRIVLTSATAPLTMRRFLTAYGAHVLAVPRQLRWTLLNEVGGPARLPPGEQLDGHPHGPSVRAGSYKTIAYEVAEQLGWRAPAAVLIPTG